MSRASGQTRAELAAQLRQLRTAAGMSGIEAGQLAGVSQSKISKIENHILRASPADVRNLCRVYGAPQEQVRALVRLATSLRSETIEPRRVILSRGAHQMQQRIRQLEASAGLLRSFQPCMVIGLLQTEAYARLVFGAGSEGPDVDRAVAARMERQTALREQMPKAVLLMTEGALRWQAGSPQVMISQLDAIADVTKHLASVNLGIIPFSASSTIFPRHGFHLYDSDAVIIGTETGTATIVDDQDIAVYEHLFSQLEELAATGNEARAILSRIADDYRRL